MGGDIFNKNLSQIYQKIYQRKNFENLESGIVMDI